MSLAPSKMNPFPGLRPFTKEEDYLFFGREEQTLELLQRLGSNRFVAVVGTSGSGKSSLVRCGLLSELLGGKMLGAGAAWEIAVAHPGGNPLALLTDALLEAGLYERAEEHACENLLATLSRSHFGLVEAVKQADLGAGTNFLLVVDQFEEIFRFQEAGQRQQEAANEFVSLLLEAVAQKEVPIYVVLTMRSDFIGECGQFEGLAEMVNRGEFLIPRLNREQYKRVIEGPIKVAGGQIAPRLLQRLLNDLGQQADQLPCLQHALMRTWNVWSEKGDTEALDLDDYHRVGKMSQALSLHADEIYEALAGERQRALCQGMFQALTVEESSGRGIRRPQRLGRLCQILEVSADELLPIIDAYRQSGVTFLMPPFEVLLTDQTIIDISHESLMRVWTRLRQWVEEETQAAGIYYRLSESAALHERGKAGLYRDPELGIALAWREAKRPNAAWAERYRPGFAAATEFLEASRQASVAEQQAREAARERELDQAQRLAEAERQRAETKARSARRLRVLLAGMSLVALFAVGASIVALDFWRAADRAKQAAEHSEQSAKTEAERATAQELAAKEARRDAEQNLTRARTAIDSFMVNVSESQLMATPGLQPLRAELLGSASKFYEDFLAHNPENPALQAGLADAFNRVGFVNNELGNHAQALVALEKSIALWDAAQKANRDDPVPRHGLAAAWYESARARMSIKNDSSGAYDAARNAARLWNALAAAHPADIVYKKSLARAYNLMGLTSSQVPDRERAFLAYQQSLQIRLLLLPDHPDDVELLHGLGESFNNLGLMVADREHTLAMLERSVEFNVVVNRLRPQNVEYALDLGIGYSVIARELSALSRKQEAIRSSSNGVKHMLQFIRANPAVPAMREMLSSTLFRIRSQALEPDQADEYGRIFQAVHDTFAALPRKTAEDHFAFAQAQSDYAAQLSRARKSVQRRELTPEDSAAIARLRAGALDSLRQAVAAGFKNPQRLKQDLLLADVRTQGAFAGIVASIETASSAVGAHNDPAVAARPAAEVNRVRLEQDRATGYLAFGMVETVLKRNAKAAESLEQALAIRRALATADPGNEQRRSDLRIAEGALAHLYWNDGKLAKARDVFQKRLESLGLALQKKPQDNNLAARLADAHRGLADAFASVALWEEAAPHYAAALKSASNYSDSPAYAEILAPALQLLIGDDNAYRTGCAQILKTYGVDASAEHAARIARLYALRPVTGDDLAGIVALAEKAKNDWHAYTYALVLYRAGRFADAIQTIEAARKANTYDSVLVDNFVLAMAHFQIGRHERAREFLKAVNGLTPGSMPAWTHFASSMLDVDWIVLRREANELIHGSPYNSDDRLRRSRAFSQLNEFDKAEAECAAVVKALPDNPEGHVAHAFVLVQMGRQDQAAQQLGKARKLLAEQRVSTAGDVELWRTYAETLSLLKRHEEASQAIRHAVAAQALVVLRPRPSNTDRALLFDLYAGLADALQAAGRPEEARAARTEFSLFAKVLGLPPLLREANDLLAIEGPGTQDIHELCSGIEQLLAANQRSLPAEDANGLHLSAKFHQRRAQLLRENGRPEQEMLGDIAAAHEKYKQVLLADPQNSALAADLADLLLMDTTRWTVLKPIEMKSKGGATLTRLDDHSVLASGTNPDQDSYTITAKPGVRDISAIRLDALPDPSLPFSGPGRSGNFVLAEMELVHKERVAEISGGTATYEQDGFTAEKAVDRSQGTGWAIWPKPGQAHSAYFQLKNPLSMTDTEALSVNLQFAGPVHHALGRFRLSVSDDPHAFVLVRKQLAALKITDPWSRLAAAYALTGPNGGAVREQAALDSLLQAHPAAGAGIGYLHAADRSWERAVAAYTKAITPETTDATLLAKRAEAYEELKQWDLAAADWTRASRQQPDVAFQRFKSADAASWRLELLNGAACSMEVVDGTLVFTTTAVTGTSWHVQFLQGQLQLENGAEYVIRFKAKSSDSCAVSIYGQINQEDWHGIGLQQTFIPPAKFKDYEFTFVPRDAIPGNNRISFQFGSKRGKVMLKEIVLLKKHDAAALLKKADEKPK